MAIEKVFLIVIITSVGWLLVGWSLGYKAGMRDGYKRGRSALSRIMMDQVRG